MPLRDLQALRIWCTAIETWRHDADEALARHRLSWSGFRTLLALIDEPRRSGELRGEVGMTTGGMAKLLRSLEEQGLIERHRNPGGDQRVVTVELTPDGRDRVQRAAVDLVEVRDHEFDEWGFDEELRDAVHRAWQRLIEAAERT